MDQQWNAAAWHKQQAAGGPRLWWRPNPLFGSFGRVLAPQSFIWLLRQGPRVVEETDADGDQVQDNGTEHGAAAWCSGGRAYPHVAAARHHVAPRIAMVCE